MNNELLRAKQNAKEKGAPYRAYTYYLSVPIVTVFLYAMLLLNISVNSLGYLTLIFAILAHVHGRKLTLLSKKKYLAPCLIYLGEIYTLIIMFAAFDGILLNYDLLLLVAYAIQLAAIIFFILTARDIKSVYPNMKDEANEAQKRYLEMKRLAKNK
ncbi:MULTISPECIES: hypothetical protein [Vagococcus]|uniref:Uncharacterized protein n=1 Tax=Vagococcus fluvialis bH819 TaxID=1255619 RepID=A0A1X6WSP3_9ENTE|nr:MULTISPECIES: hypothetical protein [Vagococcus]SLM87252.1 hypothetical protein FM121_14220 [Vagococcus fluvialis bH819]HCM89082.1 hypothetical protein [Vagococcus sp.]